MSEPVRIDPWVPQLLQLLGKPYDWSRWTLIVERRKGGSRPRRPGW
jgi:hypothetical protein